MAVTINGGAHSHKRSQALEMPFLGGQNPPFEAFLDVYYGLWPLYVHIFSCSLA